MAEIPNSDSPSPFGSSPGPRIAGDDISLFEDLVSDTSSILVDTDDDEDNEDDTSIDEEEEEESDDDDFDERGDGGGDDDFDDFDWDMREVDFDGVGFLVDDEDHPRVEDYPDFADNDPLALHHALLHLVQDHWGLHPHSPIMDQPHGGTAPRARTQRDQLVQVEVASQGNVAEAGASARGAPPAAGSQRRSRQPPPDVIDLTGDDDVEMSGRLNPGGQPARSVSHRQSENQRRLRSQTQNAPPRLNRSDGNYVDDQHIIILSSSDDEDQPMRASPRRNAHNSHNSHHHHHRHNINNDAGRGARIARFGDQPGPAPAAPVQPENNNQQHGRLRPFSQLMQLQNLPLFQFLSNRSIMANRNPNRDDDLVITGERNIGNLPNHNHNHNHNPAPAHAANPLLGLGQIQLDYAAAHHFPFMPPIGPPGPAGPPAAGAGAGPPKPVHEPPTPARPGFTRDTGEDVVAICPSCDQELAYDPEADDDTPPTPVKKTPRSRKAMAEHHFWAVKACGHVYCKRCFDNRRSSSRNPVHVSFRHGGEGGKKLLCAVEDCDSEVTLKAAWVGIFM
ncbi:hypothetical protein F4782DRAFT_514555 [Xylaria castorea]|nr:hypothetical protein F4782DRAFT_514555 [Xylaria castorea]